MKLSINLFMTLDGVSQGPGSAEEDPRDGFTQGGWLMPVFDEECGKLVTEWFDRAEALLLGRRTYDTFASHWPQVTDTTDTVARCINKAQKYVVTSQPLPAVWESTSTALDERFIEEITHLTQQPGDGELQVHGSIQLARTLHRAGLVDVYRFLIAPVVLGQGAKLFHGGGPALSMRVKHTRTTPSGVYAIEMEPEAFHHSLRAGVIDGSDTIVDA